MALGRAISVTGSCAQQPKPVPVIIGNRLFCADINWPALSCPKHYIVSPASRYFGPICIIFSRPARADGSASIKACSLLQAKSLQYAQLSRLLSNAHVLIRQPEQPENSRLFSRQPSQSDISSGLRFIPRSLHVFRISILALFFFCGSVSYVAERIGQVSHVSPQKAIITNSPRLKGCSDQLIRTYLNLTQAGTYVKPYARRVPEMT